jgi:hypothetical protein
MIQVIVEKIREAFKIIGFYVLMAERFGFLGGNADKSMSAGI